MTGGRFRLGLGVSHEPVTRRLGVATGKPLTDMRAYVEALRANEKASGPLPPIYLATLRDKMLDLAVEIADGGIWANASLSHMPTQVARIPAERRDGFFLANMIPTVIDDDRDAARAINRRTLSGYVSLPNYRNYWKQAGYEEEMTRHRDGTGRGPPRRRARADERPLARRLDPVGLGHPGARRHRGLAGHGRAADRRDVVDQWGPARRPSQELFAAY